MSNEQVDRLAEAVTQRLMNGALRTVMREEIAEVKEAVSVTASKVDDIHGWFQDLNQRVSDLEDARL